MEPLEIFKVDSPIDSEAEVYKKVISDIISDLRLASSIGRLHSTVLPEESRFDLVAVLRDIESAIAVEDVCSLNSGFEKGKDIIRISIENEKYMPELTTFLWDTYGKINVLQNDRWTIYVFTEEPEAEIEKIRGIFIADPAKSLHANMVELSIRSVPEGFRVRYHTMDGRDFLFVASEDPLEPEWIEDAEIMLNNLKTGEV